MFLVRKLNGTDEGKLYAMKVLKKAAIVQKTKTTEHTKTERQVLEAIRQSPFLVTLHYAFQTDAKLHLILGELQLLCPGYERVEGVYVMSMCVFVCFQRPFWAIARVTLGITIKPVLSDHSKIGKTMILMTNGSLMKVESIAEILLTCIKLKTNFRSF